MSLFNITLSFKAWLGQLNSFCIETGRNWKSTPWLIEDVLKINPISQLLHVSKAMELVTFPASLAWFAISLWEITNKSPPIPRSWHLRSVITSRRLMRSFCSCSSESTCGPRTRCQERIGGFWAFQHHLSLAPSSLHACTLPLLTGLAPLERVASRSAAQAPTAVERLWWEFKRLMGSRCLFLTERSFKGSVQSACWNSQQCVHVKACRCSWLYMTKT